MRALEEGNLHGGWGCRSGSFRESKEDGGRCVAWFCLSIGCQVGWLCWNARGEVVDSVALTRGKGGSPGHSAPMDRGKQVFSLGMLHCRIDLVLRCCGLVFSFATCGDHSWTERCLEMLSVWGASSLSILEDSVTKWVVCFWVRLTLGATGQMDRKWGFIHRQIHGAEPML